VIDTRKKRVNARHRIDTHNTQCQVSGVPARFYVHACAALAPPPSALAAALAAALEAEASACVGVAPLRAADAAAAAHQAGHLPRGGSALYT
jgi:hypothetical protein